MADVHLAEVTSDDGTPLVVHVWSVPEPVGVLQVTHGMGEHAARYEGLAQALNRAGWTVVAQDHRGHGRSAAGGELGAIGAKGWRSLVADIGGVLSYARSQAPSGSPVVLLGHSMGSFAVQQWLPAGSGTVDGVVLTGTAAVDLLEPALDLDAPLDLAMFNAAFEPARTDFDWLTRDEALVDDYVADPLTGFGLDTDAVRELFAGAREVAAPGALDGVRPDLPIYVVVGDADPVNGGLALVHALIGRYEAAGLSPEFVSYPGARHELTNETNRDEFHLDLIAWLRRFE